MTAPALLMASTALDLIALEVLIGVLACRLWLLPVAAATLYPVQARRLTRLGWTCLIMLSATSIALLILTAQAMSGASFAALSTALLTVLQATHYGHIWLARAVGVLALWWLAISPWPTLGRHKKLAAMLAVAALIALTRSATGHAADAGIFNAHVVSDWLHVLLTALWAGGVIAAAGAVFSTRHVAEAGPGALAHQGQRISRLASAALGGVLATGIYNAWCSLGAVSQLVTSAYGERLLLKLALVAVMLVLGATNRFRHLPRLDDPRCAARFTRLLYVEAAVAAAILAVVAVMINTSPPGPM